MLPFDLRMRHDGFGNCEELLDEEDRKKIDSGDWMRAAGDVVCLSCDKPYHRHPEVLGALWMRKLCDGSLVKL